MKKTFLFICLLFSVVSKAQTTHSLGFDIGIANVYYKAEEPKSKSYFSVFMPTFQFDYSKSSANTFWGGVNIGVTPRRIPFHKYSTGQITGVEASEGWIKVRAGLKGNGELLSFMPFLGLGISTFGKFGTYSKGNNGAFFYLTGEDSVYTKFTLQPFAELGIKMINKSFQEDKRNVSISFVLRYYPLQLFDSKIEHEYESFQFKNVQYNMIEFGIIAGIQHNFHKE